MKRGGKVRCINGDFHLPFGSKWKIPKEGEIYTISDVIPTVSGEGIYLEEIQNGKVYYVSGCMQEPLWDSKRFVSIDD